MNGYEFATCTQCGGSGRRSTARSANGAELERHERSGTPCDACNGTGSKPVLRPDWDHDRLKALAAEKEPDSTGMREVTVEVPKGETAWHPGSTKHVLHGPVTIRYEFHREGVRGVIVEGEVLR